MTTLEGFAMRYKDLCDHSDSTNRLIEDLMYHIRDLDTIVDGCMRSYSSVDDSRRKLQQELHTVKAELTLAKSIKEDLKNRNAYIVLLIDGDGLIFQEQWVRQGLEGGKLAANKLHAAVSQHCQVNTRDVKILCSIYANISGLAMAMMRDGLIDDTWQLEEFVRGFNQAKAHFDFTGVGYGKERADNKLQEMVRWHKDNVNCNQILLGISHDAGYAPFLDNILLDDESRKHISVVEGTTTVREIQATGLEIVQLGKDLFRKEKVGGSGQSQSSPRRPSDGFIAPGTQSPVDLANFSPVTSNSSVTTNVNSIHSGSNSKRSNSSPSVISCNNSYAALAAANTSSTPASAPPPKITTPLAKQFTPPLTRQKSKGNWNPGPHGLDPEVKASQQAMDAIKSRKDGNRLCNHHYVRKYCHKGSDCEFTHKASPSPDEINALRVLSRLSPCIFGQNCQDELCFYGHHCPSVNNGRCDHPACRFPRDSHPPGTYIRSKNMNAKEPIIPEI